MRDGQDGKETCKFLFDAGEVLKTIRLRVLTAACFPHSELVSDRHMTELCSFFPGKSVWPEAGFHWQRSGAGMDSLERG